MRVGLIGCGAFSAWPVRIIAERPDRVLAAACDGDADRAADTAQRFGAQVCTDAAAMVGEPGL